MIKIFCDIWGYSRHRYVNSKDKVWLRENIHPFSGLKTGIRAVSGTAAGASGVVITSHLATLPAAQHNLQHDSEFPGGAKLGSNPTEATRPERPGVTAAPMRFQSASGRIRMPATLQYGFEPMTTTAANSRARPTQGPRLFDKPLGRKPPPQAPKLFNKPVGKHRHGIRPRRVNVISFYEKETVLDKLSDLFHNFLA